MAIDANIRIPEGLLTQLQATAAAEGKSVDELAAEAVDRELKRRFWERNKREAELRRGTMTDEEALEYVTRVVHEDRAAKHGQE
jgi:hypothetical protein